MKNTHKKYVFINVSSQEDNKDISIDSLEIIFKNYQKLADIRKQGIATPFLDVIEIPEDFYEFLINQITVHKGVVEVSKSLVTYENLNAKVLCISKEELEKYYSVYFNNLNSLLDKMTNNMSDLTNQIIIMSTFNKMFIDSTKKGEDK